MSFVRIYCVPGPVVKSLHGLLIQVVIIITHRDVNYPNLSHTKSRWDYPIALCFISNHSHLP